MMDAESLDASPLLDIGAPAKDTALNDTEKQARAIED